MKKKLFVLLTVLCAMCLVLAMASCQFGGNNDNGGGGGGTPSGGSTLQSLVVTMSDGSTYKQYYSDGEITLPEGVQANFAKSDFVVKGQYSDNKTKTVPDYSLNVRRDSSSELCIEFIVGENIMQTILVHTTSTVLPLIASEDVSFEYSGEEVNVLEGLKFVDNTSVLTALGAQIITLDTDASVKATATDAGYYYVAFTCKDGYVWQGPDGETTNLSFVWQITPKVVSLPEVTGETTFEYDGTSKSLTFNMRGFGDILEFVNVGVNTKEATVAGEYICQVKIKQEYQSNYAFPKTNGVSHLSTEAVDVASWKITPKALPYPVLEGFTKSETVDGAINYHYDYTGEALAITTNVDSCAELTVVRSDGANIVDVIPGGYYVVSVRPTDAVSELASNYVWAGKTGAEASIGAVDFRVVVDPIDYEFPQAVKDGTIKAEAVYAPGNCYEFIDVIGVELTAASEALLENVWIEGQSSIVYTGNETYEAGTKTLGYTFTRSANYNPVEVEVEVTVHKGTIRVNSIQWSGWQNAGHSYNVGEGDFIYNGLAQKKEFQLSDYVDNFSLFPTVTYNIYYGATEGAYGEDPVQTVSIEGDSYGNTSFPYSSTVINAGYYKTRVTLSVSDPNVTFVDGNGEEKTVYESTWQIKKAKLNVSPAWSGTFSAGYKDYTYYTGVNKTVSFTPANCTGSLQKCYNDNGEVVTDPVSAVLSDYVDIGGTPTTYFYNVSVWSEAVNTSAVGRYKTVADITLKDGLSANYDLVVEEKEWFIYDSVIDASGMTWNNVGTYAYGSIAPTLSNVPDGLEVYYDNYFTGNVGNNTKNVTVRAAEGVDGYEGVTITLPASDWAHGEDGEHNVLNYIAVSHADYTVTKRTITIADFCLMINDVRVDDPYQIEYDEDGYFYANLILDCDWNYLNFMELQVEHNDWNSDGTGHDCRTGKHDVGEYEFSGFIYTLGNAGENYEFGGEGLEELTEDYVYGEGTNAFVIRISGSENVYDGPNVSTLSYNYVIRFSFTWSIVEP